MGESSGITGGGDDGLCLVEQDEQERAEGLALETILVQRASASLVAAGEKLLLCKRYYPVAEIIDLLELIGDYAAAQKLRTAIVQAEDVVPQ